MFLLFDFPFSVVIVSKKQNLTDFIIVVDTQPANQLWINMKTMLMQQLNQYLI